jgi:hypothetical protein
VTQEIAAVSQPVPPLPEPSQPPVVEVSTS